ncbi:MAG: hypothetical protein HQL23_00075 [Candidatus Omnitrophica bacterium]|nr:hypothetical protein [Candidatus Omnitrophota bacterium]
MKAENVQHLQRLSAFCSYSGAASVFLGLAVVLLDVVTRNAVNLPVGVFIVASGYATFRIGKRISILIFDERTEV